jgi:hypothetical protein
MTSVLDVSEALGGLQRYDTVWLVGDHRRCGGTEILQISSSIWREQVPSERR